MRTRRAGNQEHDPSPGAQGDQEPSCMAAGLRLAKNMEQSRNEENSSQNSDPGMEQVTLFLTVKGTPDVVVSTTLTKVKP